MFWDYSITLEAWRSMPDDEKKQRRIHIRAYFLQKNGYPGTDLERFDTAEFEDQFDREFFQMECRRSTACAPRDERLKIAAVMHLVGMLRTDPREIVRATRIVLPQDPELRRYLHRRVNDSMFSFYRESIFLETVTLAGLMTKLMRDDSW